jgi:phosphoserine phosphatase
MESRQFEKIYAYSDSIHDLPLLQFADISTAVNPDKKLRKEAEKRSWSIDDERISYS